MLQITPVSMQILQALIFVNLDLIYAGGGGERERERVIDETLPAAVATCIDT